MSIVSEDPHSPCFEIKSADLSLVALLLKTTDVTELTRALADQLAESPGFFDQDPVVIDISALTLLEDETIDFKGLIAALHEHALVPLAIKGASGRLLDFPRVMAWWMHQTPAFVVLCLWLRLHRPKRQSLNPLHQHPHTQVPCALTSLCARVSRFMPKGVT